MFVEVTNVGTVSGKMCPCGERGGEGELMKGAPQIVFLILVNLVQLRSGCLPGWRRSPRKRAVWVNFCDAPVGPGKIQQDPTL